MPEQSQNPERFPDDAKSRQAELAFLARAIRYIDGQVNGDELRALNLELSGNPLFRRRFRQILRTHVLLIECVRQHGAGGTNFDSLTDKIAAQLEVADLNNTMILPSLDPSAPVEDDSDEPKPLSAPTIEPKTGRRRIPWAARAAAIALVPLLSLLAWSLFHSGPLATVAGTSDAIWESGELVRNGDLLSTAPRSLSAGAIRIKLNNGVMLLAESPVRFAVVSKSVVELTAGRIVAKVPHEVTGFCVRTPQGDILDMGTEFGVAVSKDQAAHLEVFSGRVQAKPADATGNGSNPVIVTTGHAAEISTTTVAVDPPGVPRERFLRDLNAVLSLDLVDLVNGGNGTSHSHGVAIDANGSVGNIPPCKDVPGDRLYHVGRGSRVIDGCFVPDGSMGLIQTDSAGHTFQFPHTDNHAYNNIWTGGIVPSAAGDATPSTILSQVDYSTGPHSLVFMSSDRGLTIDLDAIRRLHPGRQLSGFTCTVGNSDRLRQDDNKADVFVIIDGRSLFEQRQFGRTRVFSVNIPIGPNDRFLTLAVTDGGDTITNDGILWGDPRFDLDR